MKTPVLDFLEPRRLALGPAGAPEQALDHWRFHRDGEGVGWLRLDRAEAAVNTISAAVLEELDTMLGTVEGAGLRGLVIRSAKPGGFAAGADIHDFRGLDDAEEVARRMTWAHGVVDRLAALAIPTVALIHGHCLGAGLEIALACDRRIAVGDASLGFPEVLLGLHPGLGGTFRLTGLIDPTEAMTMMLTGRSVHAARASRLGLVDAAVPPRHAEAAARAALAGEVERPDPGLAAMALGTAAGRRLAAGRMRRKTAERAAPEHYPAPYALIDLWETHGGDRAAMQQAEIASFSRLLTGETAQNLVRVFFLRERLRGAARGDPGIAHVHVVGAGQMGGEIAAWCAIRGLRTTLADHDATALAAAVGRATQLVEDRVHEAAARRAARDRLIADFTGVGLGAADLVIEAIVEKADAKRALYAELEPRMKPDAILATNTSSLPLGDLAAGLVAPERFVGLHFFNPVSRMELVEVVRHAAASETTLSRARAFCGLIDRLPVPVASAPGFLVNRVLTPYLLEAMLLIEEGAAPATVDAAAERFGMAMGPAEVADRVGLDVALEVADTLARGLEQPLPEVPARFRTMVEQGDLGRKSGRGLYRWADGKPEKPAAGEIPDDMTDRLILPMVDMAAACLREGVAADADLVDAAMIFGAGFAPFRGGPLHYARTRGLDAIGARLEELAARHGERFRPDPGLDALAG